MGKYLGQRSFHSDTHTHTHKLDRVLYLDHLLYQHQRLSHSGLTLQWTQTPQPRAIMYQYDD